MHPQVAVRKLLKALIAQLIIMRKARHVALDARVQPQYAMLQRIGVKLGQHTVECAALCAQSVHLQQQLQQIRQRVEALESGGTKLETH
ncbi:hypothetical protein D3C75_1193840 [compost metagenome]